MSASRIVDGGDYTRDTRHARVVTPSEQRSAFSDARFSGPTLEDLEIFCEKARDAGLPGATQVRIEKSSSGGTSAYDSYTISATETHAPELWATVDRETGATDKTWGQVLGRVREILRRPDTRDNSEKLTAISKVVGR